MIKLVAYGFKYYFFENWNKFDFAIVVLSLITIDERITLINFTAFRIIRVARLLRIVKASKSLRNLLKALYLSLGNIVNVGILLLLVYFVYTVAGIDLFGNVPDDDDDVFTINKHTNFRTFYIAFMTVVRCSTGEDWNAIFHFTTEFTGPISIVYWISFSLITYFIFLNLFVAIIFESFNSIMQSENLNDVLTLK